MDETYKLKQVETALNNIFGVRLDALAELDKRRIGVATSIADTKNFSSMDNDLALALWIEDVSKSSKENSTSFSKISPVLELYFMPAWAILYLFSSRALR